MGKARDFVRMLGQLATFGIDPATLATKLNSMFGLIAKVGDVNTLNTTDKTVVGAMNEVRTAVINGYGYGAMSATRVVVERTATAGQTSFTGLAYSVGQIDVHRNGFQLPSSAFTASTGTTVVLNDPCKVNDELIFVAYNVVSTQGKHMLPVMAGAMAPSVSGGATALVGIASAANQPDIVTINFDPSTERYAQFSFPLPKKWNRGTITARFRWSHAAASTNFGCVWGLQAVALSDNDPFAVAFGTAVYVTDTGGATNRLYISPETAAITVSGSPAVDDIICFRVIRKAADAADTLAVNARLHAVDLFITTNAENDA